MSHLNLKVLFGTKIQMVYLEKYLSFKYVKYEKKITPMNLVFLCPAGIVSLFIDRKFGKP